MRVTTVTCERCKQVIESDKSLVILDAAGQLARMIEKADLCGPCGMALLEWLRSKPSGEKAATP